MPLSNYMAGPPAPATPAPFKAQPTPDTMVQNSLESMLNPNSSYIQNARQRGVEYAGQRGGLNSSIAAGASERSALEAAAPLVSQSLDIQKQRDQLEGTDWLQGQQFNRELQGQMTLMPVTNAFNMLNGLQQAAMSDPELFTPDVVSGYSNYFSQNMQDIMGQYFGTMTGG